MYGRKRDEARKIAKKAIEGYVEILSKHKEPILTDEETLVTTLDFEYASTSGS
jgi:predicted RNase H-like HicB family nuclease